MIKRIIMAMILMTTFSAVTYGGPGPEMHEGLWEITVDLEIPGAPMKMPSNTFNQCIKKDEAIPRNDQPGQECIRKDVSIKDGMVSWTMECTTPGGKMTGKGAITYRKDNMEGLMTMEGQGMQMTTHFKGHRIGECQ